MNARYLVTFWIVRFRFGTGLRRWNASDPVWRWTHMIARKGVSMKRNDHG
jgi:hypothetical protein